MENEAKMSKDLIKLQNLKCKSENDLFNNIEGLKGCYERIQRGYKVFKIDDVDKIINDFIDKFGRGVSDDVYNNLILLTDALRSEYRTCKRRNYVEITALPNIIKGVYNKKILELEKNNDELKILIHENNKEIEFCKFVLFNCEIDKICDVKTRQLNLIDIKAPVLKKSKSVDVAMDNIEVDL